MTNECEGGSCGSPDYQLLIRARDALEAAMLCAELEGEGIPVVQTGGQGAIAFGETPSDALRVDLYVSADRLAEAQEVVARHGSS